jgi:hypothetical protein
MKKPTFEDLLNQLSDYDLVKFALRRKQSLPEAQSSTLEEVIRNRIKPDQWKILRDAILREGLGKPPDGVNPDFIKATIANKKETSFFNWKFWLAAITLALLLISLWFSKII